MGSSKKERGSEKRGSRHRHRDDSDDDERKSEKNHVNFSLLLLWIFSFFRR